MLDIITDDCQKIANKINSTKLANKKILITGATGLIGLHLVKSIISTKQNNKLVCLFNSEIDPKIRPLFDDNNVSCVAYDLTELNWKYLNEFVAEFDIIIHAAGYGQPNRFTANKIKTISLNTEITRRLFNHLKPGGTFLFCSTSEIYSGLEKNNISENDIGVTQPDHPRSCYIEGKRCGEAICHAIKDQYPDRHYNIKIARISLAYGPGTRVNDARVLNNLIQKAIQNNKIELLDNGSAIRTYGYITDITEMLLNIILHGQYITYNVAGESQLSILELASKVAYLTDSPLMVPESANGLVGNPKNVNLCLDRYTKEFHKSDFIDIDTGLQNTIAWQRFLYA
jgi:UDP-glucuronate decarboxylase